MIILFYPDPIREHSRLYSVAKNLGIHIHNDPKQYYDYFFFWSYNKTICIQDSFVKNDSKVFNKGCYDITKSRVEKIFGSDTFIDPEIHNGICIKKSEDQGAHDGIIINCPSKKEDGYIYQKFIDTRNKEGNFIDYRIFFSGQVDFIVKKVKSEMFKTKLLELQIMDPFDFLNEDMHKYIISKCRDFGMDFGELDVLMDETGKIYIIDVNNIPSNGMASEKEIMQKYTNSFIKFLQKHI